MKHPTLLLSACSLSLIGCQTTPSASQIQLRPIEAHEVVFSQKYLSPSSLDTLPRALEGPAPAYPYELKTAGVEGEVLLAMAIDAKGSVKEVKVGSATDERFGKVARDAMFQWKYAPATKDGKAVPCYVVRPVSFNLYNKR